MTAEATAYTILFAKSIGHRDSETIELTSIREAFNWAADELARGQAHVEIWATPGASRTERLHLNKGNYWPLRKEIL